MAYYRSFTVARESLTQRLATAPLIEPNQWQGQNIKGIPGGKMRELIFEDMRFGLTGFSLTNLQGDIKPNLPWADNHFDERVCGYPLNPGVEWKNWPWAQRAKDSLNMYGEFNHNYMERYWPKYANQVDGATETIEEFNNSLDPDIGTPNRGLRLPLGDLSDMAFQLAADPTTRQAYLPVYFPEDTGAPGRKPCTLGYHFLMRYGRLHTVYYMRSCDFYRHWADDCYLTIKLSRWVLDFCRKHEPRLWEGVELGYLDMHISSLHIFENDLYQLRS